MKLITDFNERFVYLKSNGFIDGGDITTVAEITGISRFTVWEYSRGNAKSISTADTIMKAFNKIVEDRQSLLEKSEILNEDLNNE